MKDYGIGYKQPSRRHPVRNFFYLLYTLLNATSFCGFFYGLAHGERLWMIGAGALLTVAILVGIVNELLVKRA